MTSWLVTHLAGHGLSARADFLVTADFLFGGIACDAWRRLRRRSAET